MLVGRVGGEFGVLSVGAIAGSIGVAGALAMLAGATDTVFAVFDP